MKNFKKISRENLKSLKGGGPSKPNGDTGCSYMCCSNVEPAKCSTITTVSLEESGTVGCSTGSHLVEV